MKTLFILCLVLTIEIESKAQVSGEVSITYFGHSCFQITTSKGIKILTDPVEFKGYYFPKGITSDIVTVSHNHIDHNSVDAVSGNPEVLKGTTSNIQQVISIDKRINDVRIYTVSSYHDPGKHGKNAIFVFEFDGIRVVHLGDIGTTLTENQVKAIGKVDILMIPVGGQFTISIANADKVIEQLNVQSIVFPMHYRTKAFDGLPNTADDFLKGKKNVERVYGNNFTFNLPDLPSNRIFIVLDYE